MEQAIDISIEDLLQVEGVQHKPRYSVTGYVNELEWTIRIIQSHIHRIEGWKKAPAEQRGEYGLLDTYLSQFEEE